MEGLAMLRQLIGQLQELLELYGSAPHHQNHHRHHHHHHHHHHLLHLHRQPYAHLLHHQQQHYHQQPRWCFPSLDDDSWEEGYCNLMMNTEKSESLKMLEPYRSPPAKKPRKERNRVKLLSATGSTEIMDQQIWKEFPEDLFEAVIARLPIATFFRFRAVSRKWSSMLNSQSFSEQCAQVQQTQPWFYTITHDNVNSGAMYDPSLKRWNHPTIASLPARTLFMPVASAGGLICFLDIGHRYFYVGNPLTGSFKELPPRSVRIWSRVAVGMVMTDGGYKILWVGCDGEHDVYDSSKKSWTHPGGVSSGMKLPLSLNFRSQSVCVGHSLYFLRSDPEGIVTWNMDTGVWNQFLVPAPLHLTDYTLAECRGRIMLVGLLTKNAATCVCIWELQKMTLLWKEVDRMPNIWCLEFYGKHVRMTCLGNKDLLMLSLRSRQMNRLVTYNLLSGEWLKIPGCTVPHGRKRQWIACGTVFYPCLTASA